MFFWSVLGVYVVFLNILEQQIPRARKIILFILCFSVWGISAFRLNIGNDYGEYVVMFDLLKDFSFDYLFIYLTKEPTLMILVTILNELGFKAQMMIWVYSTLTLITFSYALYKIFHNIELVIIAMTVFVLLPHMMWYSFSIVRQAIAMSIILLAFYYAEKGSKSTFLVLVIFSSTWHYSAILMLPFYYVSRKKYSIERYVCAISIIILAAYFGIVKDVCQNVLSVISNSYVGYLLNDDGTVSISMSSLFYVVISIVALKCIDNRYGYYANLYCLFCLLCFALQFSAPISRISLYLEVSSLVIIPLLLYKIKNDYGKVMEIICIIPFLVLFCYSVYNTRVLGQTVDTQIESVGNIEYDYSLELR